MSSMTHCGTARQTPRTKRTEGADRRLWRVTYSPGSGWARPVDMGGAVRSEPSAVSVGPHLVDVFYRGADGELREVSFRPGTGWARPRRIAMMGVLGGPPRAVAQPNGAVDV